MIKKIGCLALSIGLLVAAMPTLAEGYSSNPDATTDDTATSDALNLLAKYLNNLGIYLGFDLTADKLDIKTPPVTSQALTQKPTVADVEYYALASVFGAIPVNMLFPDFVPSTSDDSGYSALNGAANGTFPDYATPSTGSGSSSKAVVSATALIDQTAYQEDPVSQAVLNIIGTPDYSFCLTLNGSTGSASWKDNCLYQSKVMTNVLSGSNDSGNSKNDEDVRLPSSGAIYQDITDQKYYGQLNSNTLIAPLLYSSTGNPSGKESGLVASNQAQEAANFIRYASGGASPIAQIKKADYDKLYLGAYSNADATDTASVMAAADNQAALATYLTSVRVYAAQSSTAISNLYYILSKRLPQSKDSKSPKSSQALMEFQMATWRLFNPATSENSPSWLSQINTASDATVQKEIAILLSEINYQMYLNRQQDERILLTNSMQLLAMLMYNKPLPPSADSVAPAS